MIEIYGTGACQFCKDAQILATQHGQDYKYVPLDQYPEQLEKLEAKLGFRVRQVPQIIMDGEYIGGFTELKEKLKNGKD